MNWQAFWAMGGYGYVWSAYGFAALVLAFNLLAPIWQRKQWLKHFSRKRRSL